MGILHRYTNSRGLCGIHPTKVIEINQSVNQSIYFRQHGMHIYTEKGSDREQKKL